MTYKLYDILEVNKTASIEDIKKSYKKLAFQYHPDKNPDNKDAELKFKEISNAYSILSNESSRTRYDMMGDDNFIEGQDNNNFGDTGDINEIFNHFFGNMGGHSFGFNNNNNINKCNNIIKPYNITLEDIYNGILKNIKITVKKYCKKCNITCSTCKGKGIIQQLIQIGPMTQIIHCTCNKCNGNKFINKNNKECVECKGNGTYEIETVANLNMAKGFDMQHTIFEGLGEQPQIEGHKAGNLIFEFKLTPHSHFVKEGNDLFYKHKLTLTESIIGKIITIDYFEEQIKVDTKQFGVINPSKQYILKNRGLPIYNTVKKGNMIIEFEIKYPKSINKDEILNLETILKKSLDY